MNKKTKVFIIVVLALFLDIIVETIILIKSYEKKPLAIPQQAITKPLPPSAGIPGEDKGRDPDSLEEVDEPYIGEGPLLN